MRGGQSPSSRILFWNVNRRDLSEHLCPLVRSTDADVVVLNESVVPAEETVALLKREVESNFFMPRPFSNHRFQCFCRNDGAKLSEVHSGFRMSVREFGLGSKQLLLALVHGPDIRNYDREARQSHAEELANDLRHVIEQRGTNKLIAIGDFNMNPFDSGMNLARGFNAMMTRTCVERGTRRHFEKLYEFYYNPMWSLFGDNTEGPAGTCWDTSDQGPYGWSMLDQVIVNHSAVSMFQSVEILTSTGKSSLMNSLGHPDATKASDHFPILATFRVANNDQLLA